jgi:hypothetical protein
VSLKHCLIVILLKPLVIVKLSLGLAPWCLALQRLINNLLILIFLLLWLLGLHLHKLLAVLYHVIVEEVGFNLASF